MGTPPGEAVPPRLAGLALRWSDAGIEAEYRRWRAERALPFVRTAMYGSLAGWAVFAVASLLMGPHWSRLVVPATLLLIAPLLAAVVFATHVGRLRRWSLHASAAANLVAGVAVVTIIHQAGATVSGTGYADIGTGGAVLLVYFGCTIMRLPPGLAAAAIAPYVVPQQVLLLQGFDGDPTRQIGFTTVLWIAVMSGLLLSAVLDRVSRDAFRQERVIAAQQQAIEREHARAEGLLLNILPAPIAEQLKTRPGTLAEAHEDVTVVFADVVAFAEVASRMHATELVELLNEVFSRFDALTARHGVEKIKTIGDSYMAVSGLPSARPDHVEAGADLALAMRASVADLATDSRLAFRFGIHAGPVIAGVIGTKKFTYDLWGDTVNIAARMESHGEPQQIQVSEVVAERLRPRGYRLRERGLIDVKGKGPTRTYFLLAGPEAAAGTPASAAVKPQMH